MKKIASTARATLAPVSARLQRAGFLGGLRVPACYPDAKSPIHLH